MADSIVTPAELLSKLASGGELDFFREALLSVLRELTEVEVEAKTGASRGEPSTERLCMRNGYRERRLDTRVGLLLLPIPKLREGTYFPSFLEPRRRSEEALLAVIAEAYVKGVSTRKVEDIVVALTCQELSTGQHEESRLTLVHCKQGESRTPSVPSLRTSEPPGYRGDAAVTPLAAYGGASSGLTFC